LLPHHRQGVEIAEIGAGRTTRADVKVLAQAIVATQQDEVTRMRGWLKAWQQPAPAATAGAGATAGEKKIAALRTVSTGFDEKFLGLLIAHQKQAVKLAQSEQAGGKNPDALAFAKQIVQSRTAEIDQMQAFLSKT
jgi:uncharacterized protein (DUF305 family)